MLATTEVGRNLASQGNSLGEGSVWLMGKLGGAVIGSDGLSALVNEPRLAIGEGLEQDPDGGGPGAGIDNLLVNDSGDNRLINDAGDVLKIND